MNDIEWKLQLLFEHIDIQCKYFTEDESPCLRYGENGEAQDGSQWPACNCYGKIKDCDLAERGLSKNVKINVNK